MSTHFCKLNLSSCDCLFGQKVECDCLCDSLARASIFPNGVLINASKTVHATRKFVHEMSLNAYNLFHNCMSTASSAHVALLAF